MFSGNQGGKPFKNNKSQNRIIIIILIIIIIIIIILSSKEGTIQKGNYMRKGAWEKG